jgi:DNA-binding FadR family transcriptional regulator
VQHPVQAEVGEELLGVIKSDSDLRMIAEMHRPVLQALQFRDPELAGKEMRAHIEFFGSLVIGGGRPHDREAP